MALYGYRVKNPNYILRFALIIFLGVMASASVLFWKSQLLLTADYQEFPLTRQQLSAKKENQARRQKISAKLLQNLNQE